MQYRLILPANVAHDVRRASRWITRNKRKVAVSDKELARRKYRRQLARAVRRIEHDPELFENEAFNVRRYTSWDIL